MKENKNKYEHHLIAGNRLFIKEIRLLENSSINSRPTTNRNIIIIIGA